MTFRFNKISSILIQVLLGVLLILSLIRFAGVVIEFGRDILQQDFSAYYTAGQALNYGLSPYLNNLTNTPPLWDGIAHFRFSRFLYPPLVAAFFQPLALFPYSTAKYLWEVFTLLCLVVSLFLTARVFPLKTAGQIFIVGAAVCLDYPLETHLDRGQIDLVTLLFMTTSILLLIRKTRKGKLLGGGLLVAATLLKLQCIYILPFLLVRRQWEALRGYIYGGILLIIASIMIFRGPYSLYEYVRYELPRISGVTTVDDALGKANRQALESLNQNLPEGYSIMDGQLYRKSTFPGINYATLVAPIEISLSNHNIELSRSIISLSLFALFFALFWLWERRYASTIDTKQKEFLFWQIPLLVILLTAPLTWVMNTVWVLPFAVVITSLFASVGSLRHALSLLAMGLGLVLVLLNNTGFGFLDQYFLDKSMLGELIILISLMVYLILPSAAIRPSSKSTAGI